MRLEVERLPRPTKPPQPLWFWWSGPHLPDLAEVWPAYRVGFVSAYRFWGRAAVAAAHSYVLVSRDIL